MKVIIVPIYVCQKMHDSLLRFAIGAASQVCKAEKVALDKQRARKDRRKEILREKKLMAAQREYANALTYIDMYHSSACWKTSSNIRKEFSNLTSATAKKDATKELKSKALETMKIKQWFLAIIANSLYV